MSACDGGAAISSVSGNVGEGGASGAGAGPDAREGQGASATDVGNDDGLGDDDFSSECDTDYFYDDNVETDVE